MRTSIVVDEHLLAEAQQLTGLPTRRAVVEEALRVLIHLGRQEEIRQARGTLLWEGDLEQSRRDR